MLYIIVENRCAINMISVKLQYMICKVYNTENNSHQKGKYSYECQYMMKDMNINEQLLHDHLSCSCASIN